MKKKLIYTIYIPGQKKVEVARGVIELGKILKETRDGSNNYHEFEQWLDDERVGFTRNMANRYIRIYDELGEQCSPNLLDNISVRKLYTLASAPEEVKEEVANSKDKEEAEKKIKEYEELGDSINRGIIDSLSLNKLYTLASAPEEVKEELGTTDSQVFDSVSINKCILPRYI